MDPRAKHTWYNNLWFKRMAPIYDYVEVFVAHVRREVAQLPDPEGEANILDLACGTGNQSIAFAKAGFDVTGVDLSPDMLSVARKKVRQGYRLRFVQEDATKLPYEDSHFDASSISFGLHDMPTDIGIAVLHEMVRVTKTGGKIVIVDYDQRGKTLGAWLGRKIASTWESEHYHKFISQGIESYLKHVGLVTVETREKIWGNVQIVVCVKP